MLEVTENIICFQLIPKLGTLWYFMCMQALALASLQLSAALVSSHAISYHVCAWVQMTGDAEYDTSVSSILCESMWALVERSVDVEAPIFGAAADVLLSIFRSSIGGKPQDVS